MAISQNAIARAIWVPPRAINEIVHGKRSIAPQMSICFGAFFGQSEDFWHGLQVECDFRGPLRFEMISMRMDANVRKFPRIRALDGAPHPAVKLHSGSRISSPPFNALSCAKIPQSVIFADWTAFG